MTSEIVALWAEDYAHGKTHAELASEWGLSEPAIGYHLRKVPGYKPRRRGKPTRVKTSMPVEEMIRRHRQGQSLQAVAEAAGYKCYQSVQVKMARAGYKPSEEKARIREARNDAGAGTPLRSRSNYRMPQAGEVDNPAIRRVRNHLVFCEFCERRIETEDRFEWIDRVGPVHVNECPGGPPAPIEEPSCDGGIGDVEDTLAAENITSLLDQLPKRERDVLTLRYGLGDSDALPLRRVGMALGLSGERVRQVEEKALDRLRELLTWSAPEPAAPEPLVIHRRPKVRPLQQSVWSAFEASLAGDDDARTMWEVAAA